MKRISMFYAILLAGLLLTGAVCPTAAAETFVVTSSGDSGPGSLREAIAASNTTAAIQTISLEITTPIVLSNPLSITDGVIIEGNGATVSGSTNVFNLNNGSNNSVIRNLALIGPASVYSGIYIYSSGNRIQGCAIGTDWADTAGQGFQYGIEVTGADNEIGGASPAERNLISANVTGIQVNGAARLRVRGNYIGTSWNGMAALRNFYGVTLANGASQCMIGGDSGAGEGNLISGNQADGILLTQATTQGNSICGNIIGLNVAQTGQLSDMYGIYISQSQSNFIGVALPGYGNVISGNSSAGIYGNQAVNNIIRNNIVGLNSSGTVYPNGYGINLSNNSALNVVGSQGPILPQERNVVSGNSYEGLYFTNSFGNTVTGNYIGTDIQGRNPVPNGGTNSYQVHLLQSSANFIGSAFTGEGNLIVGNNYIGIYMDYGYNNRVFGNTLCGHAIPVYLYNNANNMKPAPVITFASLSAVWGTSQANDYIEVFESDRGLGSFGGSRRFVGYTYADASGQWNLNTTGLVSAGQWLTALATSTIGDTSQFCRNAQVMNATPTQTSTATATSTVSATATRTPTATLTPSASATCTFTITQTATPSPTITLTATGTPSSTVSATATPTPTCTITPSITPTATVSATASISPVSSATPASATHTPTAVASPTASVTPRATMTATLTPTVTSGVEGNLLAYPNPANRQTRFIVPRSAQGELRLRIYNSCGEEVAEIHASTNADILIWDCQDIAPGVYFVHLDAGHKLAGKTKVAILH